MQLVTDSLLKLKSAKYVYYRNLNIFFFTVYGSEVKVKVSCQNPGLYFTRALMYPADLCL